MVRKLLRVIGIGFGALIVSLCLVIVLAPAFLDRIYYSGPPSAHYDGAHFRNPDNDEDTFRIPAGGSRAAFFWHYLTGTDGRPVWPDHVAVTQTKPPARVMGNRMIATWIGHATVLVQTNGLNILTDPIYADTAGPFGFGPKRVAVPGVRFEDLPKIDLVLVSHDHYDHMDLGTLKRLWDRDNPRIVTSLGNEAVMRGIGAQISALDWGNSVQIGTARVFVTRNHHWGSRWFTDRNRALWSSFVIELPGGNLFFAGDTGFGDGQWPYEAAKLGPIRLALIPIGAFRFQAGQMQAGSHIGPVQAVEVFHRLGARYAMPIHWGTFRLSWEAYDTPPKLLDRVMMCRGLSDFTAYPIGAPVDVPPIDAPRAKLPPVARRASCDARPFAPDLR
ncbi:Metallo-beta-lactamase domain-containing protein [Sphingomonas antarctica]|uniref:MBL fold metallo-hydrolase n=1 Tax=Sphingomonas antarctica TaxID=2040274 RepID=UPI0039E7A13D